LNIVSLQDSDTYKASSKNAGIGFGTDKISGVHGSAGTSKTNSDYKSVTEQAGIYAGENGFDITVGKNTDLKGAVISSEATPDKNKLSTDTLTWIDLHNKAKYSSSKSGINYNSDLKPGMNLGDLGLTPNIGITVSGDASSTTYSAVSPGTIEIRSNPNQDISKLSRDTTNSMNELGKIFDKQTVKEKQELSALFGEMAFNELHKISEKNGWKDGDPKKIALHTVIGVIMAQLGGGDAFSGGFSAGLNEALQKELSKIQDPALRQWVSYVIGYAASAIAGGNPQTGGSTAVSGTKNNSLAIAAAGPYTIDGLGTVSLLTNGAIIFGGLVFTSGVVYDRCVDYIINATFPENPDDFNPDGLVKNEYPGTKNGKVIKWQDPETGAGYEWNEDIANGEHYHKLPDGGKGRVPHPDTGNDHMYPGDRVPE